MSDNTHIEWTDATWNIITGCSVVSAGCKHCYAMKLAGTRLRNHPSRAGLTQDTSAGPVWNGQVRFNSQWITQPLPWKRPRRIFVCAHGDLFHESVPDDWIAAVFGIMACAPQHTFQVLTKRADRMRQWFERAGKMDRNTLTSWMHECVKHWMGYNDPRRPAVNLQSWPLPNVVLCVSAENQKAAEDRIPDLLATPAAVRGVSLEPLLGPINLRELRLPERARHEQLFLDACTGGYTSLCEEWGGAENILPHPEKLPWLDWIIVGGESGNGSRPMHPDWARSLRDQVRILGTALFFKQWGDWQISSVENGHYDCDMARNNAHWVFPDGRMQKPSSIRENWFGGEPYAMVRVGKKTAGRLLDGVEHNEYPRSFQC